MEVLEVKRLKGLKWRTAGLFMQLIGVKELEALKTTLE